MRNLDYTVLQKEGVSIGDAIIVRSKLNERLKELRKNSGYSYQALEDLTGISRSTLQRYESNPSADIPITKLSVLAKTYEVTEAYLLGFESKELPYDYFKSLAPLLKELSCEISYNRYEQTYEILLGSEDIRHCLPITNLQLKDLKETTLSYLKFKINELINSYEPPIIK